MASEILIKMLSIFPPKYPEIPPYTSPIGNEIKRARKPIVKEILPPYKSLEKLSLPFISQPKR